MDDFYTEMSLYGAINSVETPSNVPELAPQFQPQVSNMGFLQNHFPQIFAEALVPINPSRWPAYIVGSAGNSQMPELEDKIFTPLNNVESALEYVATSQSDIQFRDRVWEVLEDTVTINGMCELGSDLGSYAAGRLANDMAEKYTDKAITTLVTANDQERLNIRMFQQVAAEKNIDPSSVRGTGLTREFVPEHQKGDLSDRPPRGARPKSSDDFWNNEDFWNTKKDGPGSGPTNGNGGDNQSGGMSGLSDDSNLSDLKDLSKSPDSTGESEGNIFGRWLGFRSENSQCLESNSPLVHDTSCEVSGELFSERAYRWLKSSAGAL